jgi:hypothetical protein
VAGAESDPACAALLYNTRALVLPMSDGGRQAREAAPRALVAADRSGFVAVRAYSHAFLASLDLINLDFESADRHCRACLSIALDSGLQSLAGQQYGLLGLVGIARGQLDEGRRQFVFAVDVLRGERTQLDVAILLGHASVLAAAEGRTVDAALARAVAAAVMTRLGLADWPMFEGARQTALGDQPRKAAAPVGAEAADADPWEVLQATLAMPSLISDEAH